MNTTPLIATRTGPGRPPGPSGDHAPETTPDLEQVEVIMRVLCGRGAGFDDPLARALDHHLSCGGARTRSRIALRGARALGLPNQDGVLLAGAVELLHNASLVQDDFQDRSESRRGGIAVWKRFGPDTAIGLTDLMISASFASLGGVTARAALPALLRQLHAAITRTLRGQSRDLAPGQGGPVDVHAGLGVARAKSGPLFALALQLPLIAAGRDSFVDQALEAACAFGTGYQIFDDIQDAESDRDGGALANVLLLLERAVGSSDARDRACAMAAAQLEIAVRRARDLPDRCGQVLVDEAELLIHRLAARADV